MQDALVIARPPDQQTPQLQSLQDTVQQQITPMLQTPQLQCHQAPPHQRHQTPPHQSHQAPAGRTQEDLMIQVLRLVKERTSMIKSFVTTSTIGMQLILTKNFVGMFVDKPVILTQNDQHVTHNTNIVLIMILTVIRDGLSKMQSVMPDNSKEK